MRSFAAPVQAVNATSACAMLMERAVRLIVRCQRAMGISLFRRDILGERQEMVGQWPDKRSSTGAGNLIALADKGLLVSCQSAFDGALFPDVRCFRCFFWLPSRRRTGANQHGNPDVLTYGNEWRMRLPTDRARETGFARPLGLLLLCLFRKGCLHATNQRPSFKSPAGDIQKNAALLILSTPSPPPLMANYSLGWSRAPSLIALVGMRSRRCKTSIVDASRAKNGDSRAPCCRFAASSLADPKLVYLQCSALFDKATWYRTRYSMLLQTADRVYTRRGWKAQ